MDRPDESQLVEVRTEVEKKRGRGGKENFPNVISGAKAEDVKRIMKNCLRWYELPRIETDEDCRQRLYDFFTGCSDSGELPTVEKMCLALGYARNTVWQWEQGVQCSLERMNLIKKAKELIATFEAEMVTEGKINPVTYIFRAKNYFGLKDTQDLVLTPNNPLGDQPDQKALEERIGALPEADE